MREDEVRGGYNLYIYVGDDPVMGYDSKGLVPDWCKCERKRDRWMRDCINICKDMNSQHGFGTAPDNILSGFLFGGLTGKVCGYFRFCSEYSGYVGAVVGVISVVLGSPDTLCCVKCLIMEDLVCAFWKHHHFPPHYLPGLGPGWESGPIYFD